MKEDEMGGACGLCVNAYRVLVWKPKGSSSLHDTPVQEQRGSGGVAPAHSKPGTRRWWVIVPCFDYFTLGEKPGAYV
jgi:hypothetical protein